MEAFSRPHRRGGLKDPGDSRETRGTRVTRGSPPPPAWLVRLPSVRAAPLLRVPAKAGQLPELPASVPLLLIRELVIPPGPDVVPCAGKIVQAADVTPH